MNDTKITLVKDLGIRPTKSGHKKRFLLMRCACGKKFTATANSIQQKNTKSCGCQFYRPKPLASYPEYRILQGMKKRCNNPNSQYYQLYGGRGITIHKEWLKSPMSFIKWCGENEYKKGLYIDRKNVDGNYTPNNCRFVSPRVSAINTRLLGKNNKSGFRGVSKHTKNDGSVLWRSRITVKGVVISLGCYVDKIDAAKAYNLYITKHKLSYPKNPTRC